MFENLGTGTSLLVQWLGFHTSMQHMLFRYLVREQDPACLMAKPPEQDILGSSINFE